MRKIARSSHNGLTKKTVADCWAILVLLTDLPVLSVKVRGELEDEIMAKIDAALKIVFDLA